MLTAAVDALRGLLKIFRLGIGNIQEFLRVPVNQRKPRALNLNHDAMAATKCVVDAGQIEMYRGGLVGLKRLRLLKTVAKFRTERLASDHLLVSTHVYIPGIRHWVRIIHGVNVNQLNDEIRVRS